MSIEGHLRAGSFIFFDRCSSFGLTLAESYTQFPHSSPPKASMDALVVSRSLGTLLAFVQSSIISTGGVVLPVLETATIGEMLVGMSSREASEPLMLA